jgi:hypothetical protein
MSTLPNALAQRAGVKKKKPLPKGTATMTIEPRAEEPDDKLTAPPQSQRDANQTDQQRKWKRIQRA